MATKLGKCEYPAGHGPGDFKCFGPVAVEDTQFAGTKLCDMGCFMQEGVDSNKYYSAAVVQSTKDKQWYMYVEYGRVGASNPQFQFTACSSEAEAERAYAEQCAEKNTKRGQWEIVAGTKMFRPKIGSDGKPKDLYLVRKLASRSTGLPDARNITISEGTTAKPVAAKTAKKKSYRCDPQTTKLMRDLMGGAVTYTRTSIQGGTIPTQSALEEGRQILQAAMSRLSKVGHDVDDQVKDKELKDLTSVLYSRIPKVKPLRCPDRDWILNAANISQWQMDIDAFEAALKSGGDVEIEGDDPMATMPVDMSWIDPGSEKGKWLYEHWPKMTRNRHGHLGTMKIHGLWEVRRHGEWEQLEDYRKKITMPDKWNEERPFHQDKKRPDLTTDQRKAFWETNTCLLAHGSRSVNIPGITREGFRFPKELVGVAIAGAMFSGSAGGIYTADDWKKSAGYTSLGSSIWSGGGGAVKGRHAFMFLCDVVLGQPHVAPGPHPYTSYPAGTHSIFGKAGHSQVQNNEFIVLKKPQIALRYLAEFSA